MTHSFPSTISVVLWALNLKKCSLSKYIQKTLSTIMIPTIILSMILKVKKFPFWAFDLRKWMRYKRTYFASFSLIFKCVINEGSTNIQIKNVLYENKAIRQCDFFIFSFHEMLFFYKFALPWFEVFAVSLLFRVIIPLEVWSKYTKLLLPKNTSWIWYIGMLSNSA